MVGPLDSGNKAPMVLAVASCTVYAAASAFVTGPGHVAGWLAAYALAWALYLALLLRDWSGDLLASPWLLLGWAAAARLALCVGEVWLSDDLWRYLLDGRVLLDGTNPFRHPPLDPQIQLRFPALVALVNHPSVPTIYPPTAQIVALTAAALGLMETGWRVLMSAVDLLAMLGVARLFGGGDRGWRAAAVYGLCPLLVFETGSNGHLEALAALPLVVAFHQMRRGRPVAAGLAFGMAILVKYYAVLLLPLWWRRRGFPWLVSVALGFSVFGLLPFTLGGVDPFVGLRTYLAHWQFNSPVFALLDALAPGATLARALPFTLATAAAVLAGWRRDDPVRASGMVLFVFLLTGPTLHPWYALWILPWLGPRPHPGLWSFIGAMGLAYTVWWSVDRHGTWELPPGVSPLIWGLVAAGWILAIARRPRPAAA